MRDSRTTICRRTLAACVSVLMGWNAAYAGMQSAPSMLRDGFVTIPVVTKDNFASFVIGEAKPKALIKNFCQAVALYFAKYKWEKDPCGAVEWHAALKTKSGHPLIYATFGEGAETTLLLGGVHPDELTPIPMAFRFAQHLAKNPDIYKNSGVRVIVAPLVNPDGFLTTTSKRTNGNGIDLNRNFFTTDWYGRAKKWWEERREKALSHFPGYFPNSEIETLFQIGLIDEFNPDKILSVHAPLGFLDYDGPGSAAPRPLTLSEQKAKRLVHTISESTRNYRIVDYSFYPGSLGNYAGNERNIPTVTLELETTDPRKADEYWRQFLPGLEALIRYPFHNVTPSVGGNASRFFGDYSGPKDERKQI